MAKRNNILKNIEKIVIANVSLIKCPSQNNTYKHTITIGITISAFMAIFIEVLFIVHVYC